MLVLRTVASISCSLNPSSCHFRVLPFGIAAKNMLHAIMAILFSHSSFRDCSEYFLLYNSMVIFCARMSIRDWREVYVPFVLWLYSFRIIVPSLWWGYIFLDLHDSPLGAFPVICWERRKYPFLAALRVHDLYAGGQFSRNNIDYCV